MAQEIGVTAAGIAVKRSYTLSLICRGVVWLSKVANIIAMVLIGAMMMLTVVDVVGRYFFSKPIIGSYELTQFMMAGVVFLGLAYTQVNKGHVAVTYITNKLSQKTQVAIRFATNILSLGFLALMVRQGLSQAQLYSQRGITSNIFEVPIVPFFSVAIVGSFLLGMVVLTDLLTEIERLSTWKERWTPVIPGIIILLIVIAVMIWQPYLPRMNPATTGILGVALLLVLIFSGIPVAYALALAGLLSMVYLLGPTAAFESLTKRPYGTAASYTLSVVPLFVLMGYFCLNAGIGRDVYHSLNKWLGHLPGGLAIASIGGCAAFAAVTGSSIACAVAIGVIAIPEMLKYNYSPSLATGSVAAGGTLGILIPPSITFMVYGVLTAQSISKLFIAGILPGVLLAIMMMAYIYFHARLKPDIAPRGRTSTIKEKLISLKHTWAVLLLFALVIGGLYMGIFSPTEGGGIGAFAALTIGLLLRGFNWEKFKESFSKTVDTTCMVLFMFIGAEFLSLFFAQSRLPFAMSDLVKSLDVPGFVVILFFVLIFFLLGCLMPTLPVVVLLVPIIYPTVVALGYDLIWFGVIVVIMVEMGLITPPVGNNVFAIAGVVKTVPLQTIYKGILPFVIVMISLVILLVLFPQIATFLPGQMK